MLLDLIDDSQAHEMLGLAGGVELCHAAGISQEPCGERCVCPRDMGWCH